MGARVRLDPKEEENTKKGHDWKAERRKLKGE